MTNKPKKINQLNPFLPGSIDFNAVVEAIEKRIPEQLGSISKKLERIERVEGVLTKLTKTIIEEVEDVKTFSQAFTYHNWSEIKKDIYIILVIAGVGILFLTAFITLQTMFLIKYIYPFL